MTFWIDAQLSPALAPWITEQFEGVEARAVRDLGLRDAEDSEIFNAAHQANAVILSKDSDFVDLIHRFAGSMDTVRQHVEYADAGDLIAHVLGGSRAVAAGRTVSGDQWSLLTS